SESSKCLRSTHKVLTTGDLITMITGDSPRHSRRRNCAYPACKHDRTLGCIKPFTCCDGAVKFLDSLHPKWDP
ncbi:hypothetical protein B0H13DRAFT_1551279, partial [Mycena leptocephala]